MSAVQDAKASEIRASSPIMELLVIAAPIVLGMTSYTVMHMVDAYMVSRLGPVEIAAQGNGGMVAFAPMAVVMGLLGVINTYVSQHLGADRLREAPKYGWAGLWMSVIAWLILLPYMFILPYVYHLMGHRGDLLEMETTYGSILLGGAVFTLGARGISHFFYGLHRPKIVLLATVAGNLLNVFANYVLIFGALGFPKLGLPGAAIGTVVGTMVELAIPLAIFLGPRMNRELGTRAAYRPDWRAVCDVFKIGWPASLQFGNEMLCWMVFMTWLIGTFGELHNAMGWIVLRYMHLSFMPAVGISFALTAIVGKYLGAGDPKTAEARTWLGVGITVAYMGLCAGLFVMFRYPMIGAFIAGDEDPDTALKMLRIGSGLMICAAVFQVFDAVGITMSGALRGAGDTIWPGMVTAVTSWLFIVGFGIVMVAYFPQFESLGPWMGAAVYIIVLSLLLLWRFVAGPWRSMELLRQEPGHPAVGLGVAEAPEEMGAETVPVGGE